MGLEQHCDCPQHFWASTRISLGELITAGAGEAIMSNHRYVEVDFECDRCAKQFVYTYEFLLENNDGGKNSKRNMRYSAECELVESVYTEPITFAIVDVCYSRMWSNTNSSNNNNNGPDTKSRDWANQFYSMLIKL